jgi:hypothetical protein
MDVGEIDVRTVVALLGFCIVYLACAYTDLLET